MLKNAKKWMKRREGASKLNVEATIEKMKEADFYMYYPHPELDRKKYEVEDEKGNKVLDLDKIPNEKLLEFHCQYIDHAKFAEITEPRQVLDFNLDQLKDKNIKNEDITRLFLEAVQKQSSSTPTDAEVVSAVVFHSVLDPKFESAEQVLKVLPMKLLNVIYEEATSFLEKGFMVSAFEDHFRNQSGIKNEEESK